MPTGVALTTPLGVGERARRGRVASRHPLGRRSGRRAARRTTSPRRRRRRARRRATRPAAAGRSRRPTPAPPAPISSARSSTASGSTSGRRGRSPTSRCCGRASVRRGRRRVDRAEVARVVGEVVEQRHHRLLERVGDVHARRSRGGVPRPGPPAGRDWVMPWTVEVDQPVGQRQPGLAPLALLHGRGEGGPDPRADQAQDERTLLGPLLGHAWLATLDRRSTRRPGTDLAGLDQVGGRRVP